MFQENHQPDQCLVHYNHQFTIYEYQALIIAIRHTYIHWLNFSYMSVVLPNLSAWCLPHVLLKLPLIVPKPRLGLYVHSLAGRKPWELTRGEARKLLLRPKIGV